MDYNLRLKMWRGQCPVTAKRWVPVLSLEHMKLYHLNFVRRVVLFIVSSGGATPGPGRSYALPLKKRPVAGTCLW